MRSQVEAYQILNDLVGEILSCRLTNVHLDSLHLIEAIPWNTFSQNDFTEIHLEGASSMRAKIWSGQVNSLQRRGVTDPLYSFRALCIFQEESFWLDDLKPK